MGPPFALCYPKRTVPRRSTLSALHALCLTALGLFALAAPATASAQTQTPASPSARAPRGRRREPVRAPSAALGYANGGRLEHAAELRTDQALRHLPGRSLHYGTDELVGLLRRASHRVFHDHRVRMTVGDLSALHGGPVGHHASHQNGRDVDVAFFVVDGHGRSVTLTDYQSFDGQGQIINGPRGWRFDTARNWAMVAALLDDPHVRVEHMFVSTALRALLLGHGRAIRSRPALMDRAALVLHQPVGALPHRNHFHVRIGCPNGDAGCIDGIRPRPRPRARPRVVRNDRARPNARR